MIVIDDLMPESERERLMYDLINGTQPDESQPQIHEMTDIYRVGDLNDSSKDTIIDGWANAMDEAETIATHYDEQIFIGVWQESTSALLAIYDGEDWFNRS